MKDHVNDPSQAERAAMQKRIRDLEAELARLKQAIDEHLAELDNTNRYAAGRPRPGSKRNQS